MLWGLVRGRRVLVYGQDVAKPMPQGHVPRSQVNLLRVSLIGNPHLGSGRLPRPGSPWTSQITGNFRYQGNLLVITGNYRP